MAFTGRATYDNVANELGYDITAGVQLITGLGVVPLLDYLGDAQNPITSVLYEWIDDELPARTLTASTAIASKAVDTAYPIGINSTITRQLRNGMRLQPALTGEMMRITSITVNTVYVDRAHDGTTADSLAAGVTLELVDAVVQEGASYIPGVDTQLDISRFRGRRNNYSHIITRPVLVSGTDLVQVQLSEVNQYDFEVSKQLKACIVDLEQAVIKSTNLSTVGGSGTERTMKGLRQMLSTNVQSVGATFTESFLINMIRVPWNNGGEPTTLLVGDQYKRIINGFITSQRRFMPEDDRMRNLVAVYETDFGILDVLMMRWLKTNELMIVNKDKLEVPNFAGRSFFVKPPNDTYGDQRSTQVIGEYGLKVFNESVMLRSRIIQDINAATNPAVAAA